jgi:protein-L-isoaspartate(D-aspartate) O-methyltransferase
VVKEADANEQIAVERSDIYAGRPVPFVAFTKMDGDTIKGTHNKR